MKLMNDAFKGPEVSSHKTTNDDLDGMHDDFDTTDSHEEVNAGMGEDLAFDDSGEGSINSDDHVMSPIMDVLQTFGVSAAEAANYCSRVIKNRPIMPITFGELYKPSCFEVYGQGNIVNASHGCCRDLNIDGLRAIDQRTLKPNGVAWDFNKAPDRRKARRYVEEEKPTWVIGFPPCTFFARWNQGLNHKKTNPKVVEERRKEAVKHLRFDIGLYKIQLDGNRHVLHEHPGTATSWMDPYMV